VRWLHGLILPGAGATQKVIESTQPMYLLCVLSLLGQALFGYGDHDPDGGNMELYQFVDVNEMVILTVSIGTNWFIL
jgi:hypothetical protein